MILTSSDIVYLSGPMTGIAEYNYPRFHAVEADIKNRFGCKILSPARNFEGRTDLDRSVYMRNDIQQVLEATAIIMLEGWRWSQGAKLELEIAKEIGLKVFDTDGKPLAEETICQEADRIVSTDRANDYGHPFHDFTRTGRMWGALLGIEDIAPEKVGLMMVALKMSREINKPKKDSRVDGCGYFKCVDAVHTYRQSLLLAKEEE